MNARQSARILLLALVGPALMATSADEPRPATRCAKHGSLEQFDTSDPGASELTEENLFANERFWPYRTELTSPLHPAGREKPLPAGLRGVLVRLESPSVARVDFGRAGVHEVPVGQTDLVERSNRVRRGELEKIGPNLIHAIGVRLVDSESEVMGPLDPKRVAGYCGYLAVFADPEGEGLAELALALAPLRERDDVLTILFPQGRYFDAQVRGALRSVGWPVPFVMGHLSKGYTKSLLDEDTPLPAVMLQTPEGRVLVQGSWRPEIASDLSAAIEKEFGDGSPLAAGADAGS